MTIFASRTPERPSTGSMPSREFLATTHPTNPALTWVRDDASRSSLAEVVPRWLDYFERLIGNPISYGSLTAEHIDHATRVLRRLTTALQPQEA